MERLRAGGIPQADDEGGGMKRFIVTVRPVTGGVHVYPAIDKHVIDLHSDAIDRFGPCKFNARLA